MGAALAIATVTLACPAALQAAPPPYDPAIDVELFQYAIGPKTFFTVSDAETADKKQLAMDALVTFVSDPFTIYNVSTQNSNAITGVRDQVITSLTEMQITGAYGISDKLQVGFNLPVIFTLQGNGLDPSTGMPDASGLQVTGLGDAYFEGKALLWRKNKLRFGGALGFTIPTSYGSDGSQFIGDNLPTLRPKLDLQYDLGRVSLGANLGAVFRKEREIYATEVGQQLMWGAAAAVHVTDRLSLIAEAFGRTGDGNFKGLLTPDLDTSPLIVTGGLRLHATSSVSVVVGGGGGVVKGLGSPNAEFFISLGFAPDVGDTDGDGIPNSRDKCPLVPEDKDGFQDEDGCSDDDNDGDGNPDSTDKCPNQAEDIDGFEDEDGCPDLDNDKDGIPDLEDKCPNDPEDGLPPFPHDGCPANKRDSDGDGITDDKDKCPLEEEDMDGFEDGDGCPDLDNDGDGIPDAIDKCPLCPEDKDGFQDEDGCPDFDNYHDGIPDSLDKCPNQPETVNGVQDEDGCPDTGGAQLVRLEDDRLIVDKVPTLAGRELSPAGKIIVDEMGLVMAGHAEVTKWLIAVGAPNAAEAKRLGDAVKERILAKRSPLLLAPDSIEVLGAAATVAKIGAIVQGRIRSERAARVSREPARARAAGAVREEAGRADHRQRDAGSSARARTRARTRTRAGDHDGRTAGPARAADRCHRRRRRAGRAQAVQRIRSRASTSRAARRRSCQRRSRSSTPRRRRCRPSPIRSSRCKATPTTSRRAPAASSSRTSTCPRRAPRRSRRTS